MPAKLSQAQQDLIWKMQHGRQLLKYAMWCGNPSSFVLQIGDRTESNVNKNTVNSLVERGLIEFVSGDRKSRTSDYRLTEKGRSI